MRTCQRFRGISHLLLETRLKYKIQTQLTSIREDYFRKEMERMIQIKNLTESIKCLVLEDIGSFYECVEPIECVECVEDIELGSQIWLDRGYRELNEKTFPWLETWKNLSECENAFDSGMICRIPYKMIDRRDVASDDFVQDFIHSCVNLESLFYVKFTFFIH